MHLRESHPKIDVLTGELEINELKCVKWMANTCAIINVISAMTRHWHRLRQADNSCYLFKINQYYFEFYSFPICLHLIEWFWRMGKTTHNFASHSNVCTVQPSNILCYFSFVKTNWVGAEQKQKHCQTRLLDVLRFALNKHKWNVA